MSSKATTPSLACSQAFFSTSADGFLPFSSASVFAARNARWATRTPHPPSTPAFVSAWSRPEQSCGIGERRQSAADEIGGFYRVVRRQGSDADRSAVFLDIGGSRNSADIDQKFRRRQPKP